MKKSFILLILLFTSLQLSCLKKKAILPVKNFKIFLENNDRVSDLVYFKHGFFLIISTNGTIIRTNKEFFYKMIKNDPENPMNDTQINADSGQAIFKEELKDVVAFASFEIDEEPDKPRCFIILKKKNPEDSSHMTISSCNKFLVTETGRNLTTYSSKKGNIIRALTKEPIEKHLLSGGNSPEYEVKNINLEDLLVYGVDNIWFAQSINIVPNKKEILLSIWAIIDEMPDVVEILILMDSDSSKIKKTYYCPERRLMSSIEFNSSGTNFICALSKCADDDNVSFALYDTENERPIKIFKNSGKQTCLVKFCPNERYVITVTTDSKLYIWDTEEEKIVERLSTGKKSKTRPISIAIDKKGGVLSLTNNERVFFWNINKDYL